MALDLTIGNVANQLSNAGVQAPANSATPTTQPTTTPTVNTSQPSPTTTTVKPASATTTNPPATAATMSQNSPVAMAEAAKTPTAADALKTAQASGPPPQDAATANTAVNTALSPVNQAQQQQAAADSITKQLQNDPGYQQILTDANNAKSVTQNQQTLLSQYQQLTADAGLPALNTELLNTQNIINGTEQDIRNEVQAANGFATNSQVMALAGARNKTLIQNYNNLLATKTAAEQQISTTMGFAEQDRANAISAANAQLGIDTQLQDYVQKFTANAQQAYANVVSAVGYSGLVNSLLNTDPTGQSLANAEATLGFQPGQLQQIAQQEQSASNLATIQASGATSPFVVTATGEVQNTKTGYAYTSPQDFQAKTGITLQQATAQNAIQKLGPDIATATKQAQLSKAQTDAADAAAINQANINQSNASAGASAASAAKTRAETAQLGTSGPIVPGVTPGYDSNGAKYTVGTAGAELDNEIQNQNLAGIDGKISPASYAQLESWWVQQGLNVADFKAFAAKYENPNDTKSYL